MFIPGGCFCCEPPEDPCTLSGCTWTSTEMSDTDLTAGTAYYNPVSGTTPDGSYEIANAQESGTGNDAPCRKITIGTIEAPQKPDTIYAICWKDNATHNPATQCPLTSVSFCVESKRHGDSDSGLTDSVVFVVRQNSRIFATAAQSAGVNWKRASGTYTQSNFTEIDGAGNPDFTATGASIEFGFALKLLVSEDEEPLDVVMFDNLCITKASTCPGCDTSNCDASSTGDTPLNLLYADDASGEFDINYSVSSSVGQPEPSHKYTFTRDGSSSNFGIAVSQIETQLPDDCRTINNVSVCMSLRGEGDGTANLIAGSVWIGIYQDGFVYFRILNSASTAPGNSLTVGRISGWASATTLINNPGTSSAWWRKCSTTFESGTSTQTGPDFTQPFDIAFMVRVGSLNLVTTSTVYIDNICVKAVYSDCCCGDDIALTSSVASVPAPPTIPAIPTGAWADAVASAYDLMNSTVIIPKGTTCGGSDVSLYESGTWSSGGSSGTWRVNKKHHVIRTGLSVSISSGFTINMTRVSPSAAATSVSAGITSSVPYSFAQCPVFTGVTILNGGWTLTGPYTLQAEYV